MRELSNIFSGVNISRMGFGFLGVLCFVLLAAALALAARSATITGGAARPATPHVVIDTLNMIHWLDSRPTADEIITGIDATAAAFRERYAGRVMYVMKDRNTEFATEKTYRRLQDCATRNRVYIVIAEKYRDPPTGPAASSIHSSAGRDDFLVGILADRWRCKAVTNDRFRDFAEFRHTLPPFYATEFAYWRALPQREFFKPGSTAYARLRRPRTITFEEFFHGGG